jgi:phage tail-like protein
VQKVEEGGVNNYVHKLPGRVSYKNITLSRGLTISRALWDWMMQGRHQGRVRRINFSIIQGAPGHNALTIGANLIGKGSSAADFQKFLSAMGSGFGKIKHWDVENAYPVNWSLSEMNASSSAAAIETLEIAHHGFSLSAEMLTPMSLTSGPSGLISF